MTETTTLALADVVRFITRQATDSDIQRIHDAVRVRASAVRAERAASVSVGDAVTIGRISPKYLSGLTGTVVTARGGRGDVELDEKSTNVLRYTQRRFYMDSETKQYVLRGVPLSTLVVA